MRKIFLFLFVLLSLASVAQVDPMHFGLTSDSCPSLSLRTETEVFAYEKKIGGKFLYWRMDRQMAVFAHSSGARESYTSLYYFYEPGKLHGIGYSILPAWCLKISSEKNKSEKTAIDDSDITTMLSVTDRYASKADYEAKRKMIPVYSDTAMHHAIDTINKRLMAKYAKNYMPIDKKFKSDIPGPVLGEDKGYLDVKASILYTRRVSFDSGERAMDISPIGNLTFIFCSSCIVETVTIDPAYLH